MKINMDNPIKSNWIVGISSSDQQDIIIKRVYGTARQAAEFMMCIVGKDRQADDTWDFGTECIGDLETDGERLHAFNCFGCYHIDYVVAPETAAIPLPVENP